MIITLSGVTGCGKSYFKKRIQESLKLDNQIIYTTRPIRSGEVNGIDKFFVTGKEFSDLENAKKIIFTFDYSQYKYGYDATKMKSKNKSIIELHYTMIYKIKKQMDNVFAIYIIPKDINIAKEKLKERKLEKSQEELRLQEIDEHANEFNNNKELQKQFDYILYNNYNEDSVEELIKIIKNKLDRI